MAPAFMATIQPGGYVSWWKALIIIILLLPWLRLLTWIDKDAPDAHLNRSAVNAGMFSGLLLGYTFFFFLPGFGLALAVLILFFAADVGTYLGIRAKVVGLSDVKVQFDTWMAQKMGRDKPKAVAAEAGQVQVMDRAGKPQPVPNDESPDRAPYDAAQRLLTRPLRYSAERIDLVAADVPSLTYLVDGMPYEGDAMDRNTAGMAVGYLKRVAGLDAVERRKPQTGMFKAMLDGKRSDLQILTSGSSAGESMRLLSNPKKRHELKLEALGFSDEQLATIQESISEGGGVVLLAAPKAQGLTSLSYGILRAHDAFLHHIHTIERAPEDDLEGITQNALAANTGGPEELKQVSWVYSQEPDVTLITSMVDPGSAVATAKYASDNRRVYVAMRAGNTFEAIRQWRKLVGDDVLAMKKLKMVIAGRMVRRLCSACKVGYAPDPATLRKLNMDPDEVGKLYMARKEPMLDAKGRPVPCNFCHDLSFKGRMGVYELFVIDDEVRQIVASGGSDNQLKQVFRKQRGKLLQEQALAQVKAGETSVEEVLRVLKADPPGASAGAGGNSAPPKPSSPKPAMPKPSSPNPAAAPGRVIKRSP